MFRIIVDRLLESASPGRGKGAAEPRPMFTRQHLRLVHPFVRIFASVKWPRTALLQRMRRRRRAHDMLRFILLFGRQVDALGGERGTCTRQIRHAHSFSDGKMQSVNHPVRSSPESGASNPSHTALHFGRALFLLTSVQFHTR